MVGRSKGSSRFGYRLMRQDGRSKKYSNRWANDRVRYERGPSRSLLYDRETNYYYEDDENPSGYGNRRRRKRGRIW